jgi:hypothetical protein
VAGNVPINLRYLMDNDISVIRSVWFTTAHSLRSPFEYATKGDLFDDPRPGPPPVHSPPRYASSILISPLQRTIGLPRDQVSPCRCHCRVRLLPAIYRLFGVVTRDPLPGRWRADVFFMLQSGVHATIAGVLLAFATSY